MLKKTEWNHISPVLEREEHARFVAAHDWPRTPLGPKRDWPSSLKALVDVMLASSQPMFVVWGPGRTLIYNTAYASVLASKHPSALGRDFLEVWDEIRADLVPIVEQAYDGEPVQMDDIALIMMRKGYPEETHFSFSYSPVRDETGRVEGFFCACTEITAQVLAERRAEAQRERMRLMLSQMPGFAAILSGPEHRFEFVNEAYRAVGGEREYLGRSVRQVFPELAEQEFNQLLDGVYSAGEPFVTRAMPILLRGEDEQRFLDFIYHPIRDDDGRVTGIFVGGYDVTQAVRAMKAFAAERDRLAAVLDGMAEGFCLIDYEFRLRAMNTEAMRMESRRREEILGRTHWELYPGSENETLGRLYKKAMAERVPVALEHRFTWPDGTSTWIDMRAYPVPDGLAVFFRNIDDKKTAEAAAREASERLNLALDAGAIAGIWFWDVRNDVVLGDERFARTFGLDPAELAEGVPLAVAMTPIHPDDLPGVAEAIEAALRQGGAYRKEYRVQQTDGSHHWIEASGRVELDDTGKAARFPGVLIDIEHRKRAEQERDRAAALLRSFMEAVPGVVYAKDRDGRMLVANRGAAELVGKPLSEILGRTDFEFLDDKHAGAAIMATDRRIMECGVPEQVDEVIRQADGSVSIWLSTKAPFRDAAGAVTGLIGSSVDVTERRRAETRRQALVDLGDRLRQLSEPEDISYAAGEIVGRALAASRAGYAKFDAAMDRVVIDRDWTAEGIPSIAGSINLCDYGAFYVDLKKGETVVIDDTATEDRTRDMKAAMESVLVRSLVNVPVIENGRLAALLFVNDKSARSWTRDEVAFVRDVAERTRTAVERRRAEIALRSLAASLEAQVAERTAERDRVWVNSRDLLTVIGADGVIRAANPAWRHALGFSPEDVVGQSFQLFVVPEDMPAFRNAFESARRGGRVVGVGLRLRTSNQSFRWISWDTAAENDVIFGYGRDVTEDRRHQEALRQAEDALRQSQKMEAVGQLTGGIAHDFNNMLAVVIGSLDLLKRRVGAEDARVKRYVDAATEGARRAATLTQRLLAFSRQQPLRPEPLDANRLVRGMTDLLRHSLGAHVRLETVLASDLWLTFADANQLENVILNLAVNARDAMPDGGRLLVETQNVALGADPSAHSLGAAPGDYVLIAVGDTGSGMPPEVLAKAFEPFFTTKEVGRGTGLGLSQVYGFVKQSGGAVKISSEPGRGTDVRIYLPRHYGSLDECSVAMGDEPRTSERRELVLVVDDEAAVRAFSVEALSELGYRVVEAQSAEAGLAILDENPDVALMFTDIVMPDVNGRKLAEEARRRRPTLKVLYTTGYTRSAILRDGLLEPGTDLIGKPFTIEELAAKVRETLDGPA